MIIGGFVLGTVAIILSVLGYRLAHNVRPPTLPTRMFKTYLSLSILLGMSMVSSGITKMPHALTFLLMFWIMGWCTVSALATLWTPPRWLGFPLGYIGLFVAFTSASVLVRVFRITCFHQHGLTILFGALVTIGACTTYALANRRRFAVVKPRTEETEMPPTSP